MAKYSTMVDKMMDEMASGNTTAMGGEAEGSGLPAAIAAAGPEAVALMAESKMRCGGCGAKVGVQILVVSTSVVWSSSCIRSLWHPLAAWHLPAFRIVLDNRRKG